MFQGFKKSENRNLFSGRQTARVPLYKVETGSNTKGRDPKQSVEVSIPF